MESESLTNDDILETMRTLNAINSAVMVGAHVAIEKFMARKNVSKNHRKFFINEIAKSLVQNPQIRKQVVEIQRGGVLPLPSKIKNFTNNVVANLKQRAVGSKPTPVTPVSTSTPQPTNTTIPPAPVVNQVVQSPQYQYPTAIPVAESLQPQYQYPMAIPVAESLQPQYQYPTGIPVAESLQPQYQYPTAIPVAESISNSDDSDERFQSNMENTLIESMMENYGTVTKGIFKKIVQVSSNIFGKLINIATGGILYKPPEELTSETNKIILVLSMVLKDLSTDERQIQAMKDISEVFTKTMLDVMDVILPSVKMMISKIFDTISTIGAQGASGGMKVFISAAKAAIGQVPIIGGIINLILAFGEAFNVFMQIIATLTTKGSRMSNDFVDAYIKARSKFEESFARHKLEVEQLRALRDASPPINNNITQLQSVPVPTLQTQTNNQTSGILPKNIPQPPPERRGMISKFSNIFKRKRTLSNPASTTPASQPQPQPQPQQKKSFLSRLPVPWRKTQKNLTGGKRIINVNQNKKYKTIKIKIRRKKQMVNKINKNKNKKRKTVKMINKYKKLNHKTRK